MTKRLNDTKAVSDMSKSGLASPGSSYNESIRKIQNGYVKSSSCWGKNGSYESSEIFYPDYPEAISDSPAEAEMGRNGNAMSRAVEYMKK